MSDNWVVQNLENALDTWNEKLSEIWTLLTQSPQDFKGGGIWTVIVNINGAVQAIGLALLVLFFVIGMVKSCSSFVEVKKPELDATIVGKNIATQIEHMIAYRRAIKMAVANTMRAGAEGIKVQITGRLNGAEMARKEMYKEGRTPLHTFRADIDYCQCEALTKVGLLGIKVWICRGEVYGKADLTPNFSQDNKSNNRGNGRSNNRGGNRKRNNNR